jgi:DNA-binding transcriptional MerR regulator
MIGLIKNNNNTQTSDEETDIISVEQLIKDAAKKKIDLGKGDPYNRLRYYTKIGWIPHMTRKKGKRGATKGHYPKWVLQRLEYIHQLKNKGLSNEEITKKIEIENSLSRVRNIFGNSETKNKIVTYVSFAMLLIIFIVELGIVPIGASKSELLNANNQTYPKQIIDSGKGYIRANNRNAYIKSTHVTPNSKIYVSFNQNYSPAVRYWVGEMKLFEGFNLVLDAPTAQNAEFSWWITN